MRSVSSMLGNAYEGFRHEEYPKDLQGWGGHQEFFSKMVQLSQPKLIVEVGTWKGKSAIAMAEATKTLTRVPCKTCDGTGEVNSHNSRCWSCDGLGSVEGSMQREVVCVDTWLGATEFIGKKDDDPKRGLMRKNGYPQVYYQFLANVCYTGLQEVITPFPQASTNAARWFKKNGIKAGLIYVDGSHEYDDVVSDLLEWSQVLEDGGIMFGDDYCEYWRGVIQAVNEFAGLKKLYLQTKRYPNGPGEAPSDYWVLSRGGLDL